MLPSILICIFIILAFLLIISVITLKMVKLILRRRKAFPKSAEKIPQLMLQPAKDLPLLLEAPKLKFAPLANSEDTINCSKRIYGNTVKATEVSVISSSSSSWTSCSSCVTTADSREILSSKNGASQGALAGEIVEVSPEFQQIKLSNNFLKQLGIFKLQHLNPQIEPPALPGLQREMTEQEHRKYVSDWITRPSIKRSEALVLSKTMNGSLKKKFEDSYSKSSDSSSDMSAIRKQRKVSKPLKGSNEAERISKTSEGILKMEDKMASEKSRQEQIRLWKAERELCACVPCKVPRLSEDSKAFPGE